MRRRRDQEAAWGALLDLGWARRTRRQDVLALDEKARGSAEKTLQHAWPDWPEVVGRLAARGLPPTPAGLADLERRNRVDAAGQDAVVSDDVLVVHVPGWNTRTTRDLLKGLDEVPVVHFGDLDPNGLAILAHLRRWRPRVRWLVPSYWEERRDDKGLTRDWPDLDMPHDAPDWVRQLPERRTWLEQEVVAVDSRFGHFLEMEIQRALSK